MAEPIIEFSFDDKAEAAQRAAEELAARMIVDISAETEANIKALILRAIRDGVPPYEAADLIHDLIGLTAAQGEAVRKYKAELGASGLAPATAEAKVAAYADELLDSRAETIARSEIMEALNAGQDDAWAQAQDAGLLSEDATKEWILSEDPCPECEDAARQDPAPVGDEFPSGDPPLHPRCRCTIGIATP